MLNTMDERTHLLHHATEEEIELKVDVNKEMRIVLLGNTGAGKSATGNSILMKVQAFKENDDAVACSKIAETKSSDQLQSERLVTVTDTPGFCSTQSDDEVNAKTIVNFLGQMAPGPHAFAIVVSVSGRVTAEIQETVKNIVNIFGVDAAKYIIMIFTHVDSLNQNASRGKLGTSIDQWVNNLVTKDKDMGSIISNVCQNRYVAFDNHVGVHSDTNRSQTQALIKLIESMLEQNGNKCLENEGIKKMEEIMKELDKTTGSRATSRTIFAKVLGLSGGITAATVAGGIIAEKTTTAVGFAIGAQYKVGACVTAGACLIGGIAYGAWTWYKKTRPNH